jgi:hypothetical protein
VAGLLWLFGVDQRLGHGGGHPRPQPGGWLRGHEFDGVGPHAKPLLDPASVHEVEPKTLVGNGRLGRIGGAISGRGGILGKAHRAMAITGSAGGLSRPQQQTHSIGAADGDRAENPLPQLERRTEVAECLGGGQDRLSFASCRKRGPQRADRVVALQAVVGELGCDALRFGGQQASVGGMQPHLLAGEQLGVDRLL